MNAAPFAVPPAASALRFALVDVGDHLVDGHGPDHAAARFDASAGLTNAFGARLSLPLLANGHTLTLGSGVAALSYTSVTKLSVLYVRTIVEAGIALPSPASPWAPGAALPLARDELGGVAGGAVIVGHRSGLAVVPWLSVEGFGGELVFAPSGSPIAVRAGVEVPSADGASPRLVAGAAVRLDRGTELALFTAIPVKADATSPAAPLVGLGVRFDLSTAPRCTYQDAHGDVRQVTRAELLGRELGALAVAGKATLVELGTAWCEPCRAAEPQLLAIAREEPRIALRFVDLDELPEVLKGDGGASIPIFVALAPDGREVARVVGWNEVKVRQLVARALAGDGRSELTGP